jgi:hypothetical protein
MSTRQIRALLALATLVGAGGYFFVYLYRWEWNRALVSGVIFLAAELALLSWQVSDRLGRLEQQQSAPATVAPTGGSSPVLLRLQEAAPAAHDHFAWLTKPSGTNVFIPVLMGAGFLLSGLAWVVERIARATAQPVAERGLARQLEGLALPARGLLAHEHDELELLRGPVHTAVAPTTAGAAR